MPPDPAGDGGGKFPAGLRPVLGRAKVARLFAALVPKMLAGGPATGGLVRATAGIRHAGIELSAAEVNGSAAMLAWSGGVLFAAIVPEIGPDGITALYTIANPDKLVFTARQAAGLPRSGALRPSGLTPSRNAGLAGLGSYPGWSSRPACPPPARESRGGRKPRFPEHRMCSWPGTGSDRKAGSRTARWPAASARGSWPRRRCVRQGRRGPHVPVVPRSGE